MRNTPIPDPDTTPHQHHAPIELHWMTSPSLDMAQRHDLAARALCGTWIRPDDHPDGLPVDYLGPTDYVSCALCDALHDAEEPSGTHHDRD